MQEQILYFFQAHSSIFLDRLFVIFTLLGEDLLLISIIAWVYWNHHKSKGRILAISLIFSIIINNILKIVFRSPRPFEVLHKLQGKRMQTATGYSFPSGHTMGAATFYSSISFIFKNPILYVLFFLSTIAVALSRVYLAVHWPVDVLASIFLGVIIGYFLVTYLTLIESDNNRIVRFFLILNIIGVSAAVIAILCKIFLFQGNLKTEDLIKTTALLNGLSWGFIMDIKKECFITDNSLFKKVIRYILGLLGTYTIVKLSKNLMPESTVFDYLRYFTGAIWLSYVFPFLGKKMNLFKST